MWSPLDGGTGIHPMHAKTNHGSTCNGFPRRRHRRSTVSHDADVDGQQSPTTPTPTVDNLPRRRRRPSPRPLPLRRPASGSISGGWTSLVSSTKDHPVRSKTAAPRTTGILSARAKMVAPHVKDSSASVPPSPRPVAASAGGGRLGRSVLAGGAPLRDSGGCHLNGH